MIVLPRALARQLRTILRRCLQPLGPSQPPWVRLHTGPHGLEMAAHQQQCVTVYQQPGKGTSETLFVPSDVLADIQGKDGEVVLETTGEGKGEARWDDAGVPRCRPFETVKSEKLPEMPAMPKHFQPVEPVFLHALAEATRTTARDPLVETEALRVLLHDAQFRLNRLLAALKQQRRHNRALRAAMDSLRDLRLDR